MELRHIFLTKQAYEDSKPTRTPGADRSLARIQRKGPDYLQKRDAAKGVIAEIMESHGGAKR